MSRRRCRITVLTPLLAGGGEQLTPIDYMVWQNEVRVLDQERIFRLLARNPRLESYLDQLRRAQRLEWSQWGGYAQSYAAARIPFASGGLAGVWEKARNEDLHIPLFARGGGRRILAGSALKGALRTAWLGGALADTEARAIWKQCMEGGNRWRTAATLAGVGGGAAQKAWGETGFGDARLPADAARVYQTRTLVLRMDAKAGPAEWKPGQQFAEMARPGTVIELSADVPESPAGILEPARVQGRRWLAAQASFARQAGLKPLIESMEKVRAAEESLGENECLLLVGWGAGFASKTLLPAPEDPDVRRALGSTAAIRRSFVDGLPFPKSHRIALDGAGGAAPCGWCRLTVDSAPADRFTPIAAG
jgi:CRISPR-associated protein Csm5